MNVAVGAGLAFAAVMAVCLFVLWFGSAVLIDKLEDRIEIVERNWAEQFGAPVEDDSPEAMVAEQAAGPTGSSSALEPLTPVRASDEPQSTPDEMPTDEFPALPSTEPMAVVDPTPAVQARRDAAWDQQRPSPVPRGKSAEWVEEAIKGFDYSGRKR